MPNVEKGIAEFQEIISQINKKLEQTKSIGIDAADVGELIIEDYKSEGYTKAVKLRGIEKAYLKNIDATAPSDLQKIVPILKEIVTALESQEKSRTLRKIVNKLASFGTWVALGYNILHDNGIL